MPVELEFTTLIYAFITIIVVAIIVGAKAYRQYQYDEWNKKWGNMYDDNPYADYME